MSGIPYDAPLDPANKQAAMIFAGGEHYAPKGKIALLHKEVCPPLIEIQKNWENLTGLVVGRLTAVGPTRASPGSELRWAVRCACGKYETRTAKALKNPNNFGDRCHVCRHVANERRSYEFHKHGREIDVRKI